MANAYIWKVVNLEVAPHENGLDDVVKVVHYTVDAFAEDGLTAGAYGSVGLNSPEGDFTAYADLTQDTVIEWVKGNLGGEDRVAEIYTALDNQIETTRNPPVVSKELPWA